MTRGSSYTKNLYYTLQNAAHGLVFQSRQYIAWTVIDTSVSSETAYNITLVSANPIGGWFCWAHQAVVSQNNTGGAYGYYAYGNITKDPLSWVANVGLKVNPTSNGNAYQTTVYEDISSAGDPWSPPPVPGA